MKDALNDGPEPGTEVSAPKRPLDVITTDKEDVLCEQPAKQLANALWLHAWLLVQTAEAATNQLADGRPRQTLVCKLFDPGD